MRLILTSSVSQSAVFQFTHPGRGATHQSYRCGYNHAVSIHAPREGCDVGRNLIRENASSFNSRTPGGVRQSDIGLPASWSRFQFTHPGRGATHLRSSSYDKSVVSIHAPREGCDKHYANYSTKQTNVSIHAPREGCDLVAPGIRLSRAKFQFTHPGRGATIPRPSACIVAQVSIHAPREGCDRSEHAYYPSHSSFNSRTPGGVRRSGGRLSTKATEFQFTHPGRGATSSTHRSSFSLYAFQFTHPGRGATRASYALYFATFCFNSRTPGGVRHGKVVYDYTIDEFQFTHPGRGATHHHRRGQHLAAVSIHAPREGCDLMLHNVSGGSWGFQFTHPGRGATRSHPLLPPQ